MMKNWRVITPPLSDKLISTLHAGDTLLINGTIYTARDKAHQRLFEMYQRGEPLPFKTEDEIIYYVGPSPAPLGLPVGSAGPTTSYRMDPFMRFTLDIGLKGFIGKGTRSPEVRELLSRYKAVYFSTFGGAGAFLSKKIISSRIIAFKDLGPEAIYQFEVKNFPVIVVNDIFNGDLYENVLQKK